MFYKTRIKDTDKVVVLTGAGISAESGIKTFRDSDGLWEEHSIEDVATPQGFRNDSHLVWDFYTARFEQLKEVSPNPGHTALAELERHLGDNFLLVTQNIDGLHLQAGSKRVLEMHGSVRNSFCNKCGHTISTSEVLEKRTEYKDFNKSERITKKDRFWFKCTECSGFFRPDIVWFGEMPYHLDEIMEKLQQCTFFLVIGTSGVVYPAAQFLMIAKQRGARTIGVNLEPPENRSFLDEFHQGKAGEMVPKLVSKWIS